MSAPVFRCTACCAPTGQPHADGCQAESADGWHVFANPPAATIHTRLVGGVLCRWWGDGPVPPGVALIDAAARPAVVSEGQAIPACQGMETVCRVCNNEISRCVLLARPAAPAPAAPDDEPDLDGALLQKILDAYARRFPAHIGCSASEVVDEVVSLIGKRRI